MTVVCRRGLSWSRIWRSLKRTWLQLAGSLGQWQARLIHFHFHLLQPSSPPSSSCPPSSSSLWPPTAQFLCLLQPNMCCCEIVGLRRRCNFCCDFAVSFREKLKAIFTRGPTLGRDESSSGSVFNSQKKYIWRIAITECKLGIWLRKGITASLAEIFSKQVLSKSWHCHLLQNMDCGTARILKVDAKPLPYHSLETR